MNASEPSGHLYPLDDRCNVPYNSSIPIGLSPTPYVYPFTIRVLLKYYWSIRGGVFVMYPFLLIVLVQCKSMRHLYCYMYFQHAITTSYQ